MDIEKLNKKLAEWAGFENDGGRAWWEPEQKHWVWNQYYKNCRYLPNFTQSLDACFKWLVPRASEDGYEIAVSTEGKDYYGEFFGQGQGNHFQAKAETPALALCLVIEKLIDDKK